MASRGRPGGAVERGPYRGPVPPARTSTPIFTRAFVLAFGSSLCFFLGIGMVIPVLPVYVTHQLGGNSLTVGIVVGIFSASAVLARPASGHLGNRYGRRIVMVVGSAIVAVSLALYGAAPGILVLVLLRLVTGVGEGAYFTGSSTLVADMAPPERRAQTLSYFSVALFTGLGVGPLLGQAMYRTHGPGVAFALAGSWGVIGSLLATRVPDPPVPVHHEERPAHLFNRTAIGPGAVLTLGIMGITAFQAFTPLYVIRLHMAGPQYVFLTYSAVVLVTRIVAASAADRAGVIPIASFATSAIVAGLGTMAAWGTPAGLYVGTALFGVGIALQYPALLALVVNRAQPHERAAAIGTFTTSFDVAQGASGAVLGLVAAAGGYRASFGAAAGFAVVGLVLLVARVGRSAPGATRAEQVLDDPDAWLPPGAD